MNIEIDLSADYYIVDIGTFPVLIAAYSDAPFQYYVMTMIDIIKTIKRAKQNGFVECGLYIIRCEFITREFINHSDYKYVLYPSGIELRHPDRSVVLGTEFVDIDRYLINPDIITHVCINKKTIIVVTKNGIFKNTNINPLLNNHLKHVLSCYRTVNNLSITLYWHKHSTMFMDIENIIHGRLPVSCGYNIVIDCDVWKIKIPIKHVMIFQILRNRYREAL